jgi:hypothetical protein
MHRCTKVLHLQTVDNSSGLSEWLKRGCQRSVGNGAVTREPVPGAYLWFVALFQLPGVLKRRFRQREAEKLGHRPAAVGDPGGHRRGAGAIALRELTAFALDGLGELYAQ